MIVQLTSELRIRGTEHCYQLERKQMRKGVDDWKPFKYYTKFAHAVGAACEREIRCHPADNLADAIEAAAAVSDRYGQPLHSG